MRHWHKLNNRYHCPTVNVDKLWTLVSKDVLEGATAQAGKAPVIDCNKAVRFVVALPPFCASLSPSSSPRVLPRITPPLCVQGFFKVLGKGRLPSVPVIVRAKFFSKSAEKKIVEAGGACQLTA